MSSSTIRRTVVGGGYVTMAITLITSIQRRIGLSTDTKPTSILAGSTFYEYDTQRMWITPDGTNWFPKGEHNAWALKTINLKQAANDYDLFTVTTQNIWLDFLCIIIPRSLAAEAVLTSISIQSTDASPVTIISSTAGAKAKLLENAHLVYTGGAVLASTKKIQLTIAGGATAADCNCTVITSYRPVVAGGYLLPA